MARAKNYVDERKQVTFVTVLAANLWHGQELV